MTMHVHRPLDRVIWLDFDTQREAGETLYRMQEFYESPIKGIRGCHFHSEIFKSLYARAHGGKFTYFEDWSGFNFPGDVADRFFEVFVADLTPEEEAVHRALSAVRSDGGLYYVIGTHRGEPEFDHELSHALYYLDSEYRENAQALLYGVPRELLAGIEEFLRASGYDPTVFRDECVAYLATTPLDWWREMLGDLGPRVYAASAPFKELFDVTQANAGGARSPQGVGRPAAA